MNFDKGLCWFAIMTGILSVIFGILCVKEVFKNKKIYPDDFAIPIFFVAGLAFVIMGVFFTPYTNTVEVTVAETNKKYLVEKDGDLVDIDHYEKIINHGNERYQLKTKTNYSMTGRKVSKKYTLVIPLDAIQEG